MEVKENISLELNKTEASNLRLLVRDLQKDNGGGIGFKNKTIQISVNQETAEFITELDKKLNG